MLYHNYKNGFIHARNTHFFPNSFVIVIIWHNFWTIIFLLLYSNSWYIGLILGVIQLRGSASKPFSVGHGRSHGGHLPVLHPRYRSRRFRGDSYPFSRDILSRKIRRTLILYNVVANRLSLGILINTLDSIWLFIAMYLRRSLLSLVQ